MSKAITCPDLDQYRRLTQGGLAREEKEALLEHLENCDVCARKLSALPVDDPLIKMLHQAKMSSEGPSAEIMARLVERLSKLQSEASPGTPEERTLPPAESPVGAKTQETSTMPPREPKDAFNTRTVEGTSTGLRPEDTLMDAQASERELYDFLAPPQAADELGRLGPYRVLKVLGAGGMGVVFRAEDPHLQRLVALKAMLPALAASTSAKQRFLREARAAAAIKHDHIVTIHQVGEDRGAPFLAMEFLEGEPLDERLEREGKLPLQEVLRIGREMAEGLEAAHERGLIHRDIKPANIWLEGKRRRVKILDFGLARAASEQSNLTQQGAIVGTPSYMAPEQAQGRPVDHRCDLFSLGCVLYRLTTGALPFKGTDTISTLMAVATENPRPPAQMNPAIPPALSDLIMKLLAKKPEDRLASAREVHEALEAVPVSSEAPRPGFPPTSQKVLPALPASPLRWPKFCCPGREPPPGQSREDGPLPPLYRRGFRRSLP